MNKSRLIPGARPPPRPPSSSLDWWRALPEKEDTGSQTESGVNAKEATSAADFGGMDGLVEAAKAEGQLNVIALPPDWANYGAIIKAFEDKYGIKVNSAQPDANSQDEINAANQLAGTDRAPDVFDLGQAIALANTGLFAPYKVSTFDDIPTQFKDPNGSWVNDYGGYMSIGYDSAKVPEITGVNDLLRPEFKGKVALNDPTTASAAANGVLMTAIANGGSVDDIAPGVDFFGRLKDAGNFLPVDPTPATIESGQTPVVIDWDYLNSAETAKIDTWKVFVPSDALVGLLLPGDQQGRSPPCRGSALAGVPLQRRGSEPLPEGPRPTGARGRDGKGGHRRQEPAQRAAVGPGHPGGPDRRAEQDGGLPRGQLVQGHQLTMAGAAVTPAPVVVDRKRPGPGRKFAFGPSLALLPFLTYLTVFLVVPTVTVLVGAFQADEGGFTLEKLRVLNSEAARSALWNSILLSASTAVIGAVLGALLAYLVVTARPTSILRRVVLAVCGVLAQFGGVTLAFAFIATVGFSGVLTEALRSWPGIDIFGGGWLFDLPGLILVYTYFQIPLMVIVFMPALHGVRPQWREAVNLGASTRQYWTQVGFPLLLPAFLGSMLLLFANAFAAYATAAALVSQGSPITPLLIRAALTSETLLGQADSGTPWRSRWSSWWRW